MRDDSGEFEIPDLREDTRKAIPLDSATVQEIFGSLVDTTNAWGQEALRRRYVQVQKSATGELVVLTESGVRFLHNQTREFGNFDNLGSCESDEDMKAALRKKFVLPISGLDGTTLAVVTERGIREIRERRVRHQAALKGRPQTPGGLSFQRRRQTQEATVAAAAEQPSRRKRVTRGELQKIDFFRGRMERLLARDLKVFEKAGHSFSLDMKPNPEDAGGFLLTIIIDGTRTLNYQLVNDDTLGTRITRLTTIISDVLRQIIDTSTQKIDE